jgi:cell division inhibitor SepF
VSFTQKLLTFVGLADDDFLDDEELIDEPPRRPARATLKGRSSRYDEYEEEDEPIRRSPRAERTSPLASVRPAAARKHDDLPPPRLQAVQSGVRPIAPEPQAPQIVALTTFREVTIVGEHLREGRAVIVNLQQADSALMRRVLDFISGATFAIKGKVERVSEKVYLVIPSNVQVSDDDRSRARGEGAR